MVFTGRLGGGAFNHSPWVWKRSERVAVRSAAIEVDHTRQRQWLRIRDRVTMLCGYASSFAYAG
jgi:hypothetical protein